MRILNQKEEREIQEAAISHIRTALSDNGIMEKDLRMRGYCPYMEWFNIALVRKQMPEATYAMSADAWSSLMHEAAHVRKGESSARVMVPVMSGGRIRFYLRPVFDVAQLQKCGMVDPPVSPITSMLQSYGGLDGLAGALEIPNDSDGWNGFIRSTVFEMENIQNEERIAYVADCMAFQLGLTESVSASAASFLASDEAAAFCYRTVMRSADAMIDNARSIIHENECRRRKEEQCLLLRKRRARGIEERIRDSKIRLGMMDDAAGAASSAAAESSFVKEHVPQGYAGLMADESFDEDENPQTQQEIEEMEAIFG